MSKISPHYDIIVVTEGTLGMTAGLNSQSWLHVSHVIRGKPRRLFSPFLSFPYVIHLQWV